MKTTLFFLLFSLLFFQTEGKTQSTNKVIIDGSSTVFPILDATTKIFLVRNPQSSVAIHNSGTGGGFLNFCTGNADINGASRRMTSEEIECARDNNVSYSELIVALDGVTIVVHPRNTFINEISTDELRQLWSEAGTVEKWSDLQSHWPDRKINLYTRGVSSGTYDFFMRNILISEDKPTTRYLTADTDDDLIDLIAQDEDALGFLGFAYYVKNTSKLRPIAISSSSGPVLPNYQSINNGDYSPLSRQLYMYVNTDRLQRNADLQQLTGTLYRHYNMILRQVGYVSLNETNLQLVRAKLDHLIDGELQAQLPDSSNLR